MGVHPQRRRRSRFAAPAILALSLVALLLWGKLKLVASVPRTAYAVPEQKAEGKGQKAEGRRQMAGGDGRAADGDGHSEGP